MMRHCCGSNDHPDSSLFIQMYRLVSTYSLVKPPKGSNVSGGELVDVLLKIKDLKNEDERKQKWDEQIDKILDQGRNCSALYDAATILEDHDYFKCSTSDYVLAYVSGFVVRKCKRFLKHKIGKDAVFCQDCFEALIFDEESGVEPELFKLINIKTKGYLIKPSMALFNLITILERATLDVIQKNEINSETLFEITTAIEKLGRLPMIGCEKHKLDLTHRIIRFYLTTRMFFITKQVNKNENIEKERTREKRKLSKLATETPRNEKVKNTIEKKNVNKKIVEEKTGKEDDTDKKTSKKTKSVPKYKKMPKKIHR